LLRCQAKQYIYWYAFNLQWSLVPQVIIRQKSRAKLQSETKFVTHWRIPFKQLTLREVPSHKASKIGLTA
jgi:hypothetical protein